MSVRSRQVARAIRAFVDHPVTKLIKGIVLLVIGVSEASRTLAEDLAQKHLRVGHGLIIIGVFGILDALPHLIDALDAGGQYLDSRECYPRPGPDPGAGGGPPKAEPSPPPDEAAGADARRG